MNHHKKRHHLKHGWKIVLIIMTSVCLVCAITGLFSPEAIQIQLNGNTPQTIEYGSKYTEQGGEAYLYHSLLPFIHKKVNLTISGSVDEHTLGTYILHYTASSKQAKAQKDRKIIVQDTTPPEINLISNPDHYTLPNHPYEEEGYTADDNYDGDITNQVKAEEKDGYVYYAVSDSSGNKAEAKREIIYDDRTAPTITLNGGKEVVWFTDAGPYQDSYQAIDDADGDITADVTVEGNVNTQIPGDYSIKYTIADAHNNTTSEERIVHVQNRPVNQTDVPENSKTIYLTFDDGPGPYTEQLLCALAKYNVRATFFTTSTKPAYNYVIAKEAAAGHTVAIHTYSHNYSTVYASTDAFWNDFNAQNTVVFQQTGSYTTLFRFPGGSSNTVSRDYCQGIMTELTNEAVQRGYTYFDWNVSSGDAGGTTSTDDVFNNVTSQVSRNSAAGYPSVVLQHDIKDFSVNAVEKIILWGLENGYNFQSLHAGSYTAHHGINN